MACSLSSVHKSCSTSDFMSCQLETRIGELNLWAPACYIFKYNVFFAGLCQFWYLYSELLCICSHQAENFGRGRTFYCPGSGVTSTLPKKKRKPRHSMKKYAPCPKMAVKLHALNVNSLQFCVFLIHQDVICGSWVSNQQKPEQTLQCGWESLGSR